MRSISARAPSTSSATLALITDGALEDVVVLQQVGLESEHLLQPQRPLLVPRTREAERLVPRRQLQRAGAGVLRERHAEHLEHDPLHVVLGLRLGQPERVDLHAVAEPAHLRVLHAVALAGDLSQSSTKARILHVSSTNRTPALTKNEIRPTTFSKSSSETWPDSFTCVEHRDGRAERVGELLGGRRAGLLEVVAADVDRVPLRDLVNRVADHVADQAQGVLGREHVGPAGEVLLDDVVLGGAGELRGDLLRREVGVLLLGDDLVHRQHPHRDRVDGHRGVHLGERDLVEQLPHLAQVRHRYADLADLAARHDRVGVVAGLGRQVEGHREPRLALGEVGAVERVGRGRRRVAGVGAHHPGLVLLRTLWSLLGHGSEGRSSATAW